jgi:pimeloyl-ACP methyl ester carboxylesterase
MAGLSVAAATGVRADLGAPRTFVLVHGAWHGGWCWRYVRERLHAAGHRVHTPTLTGLGERSHLLSPQIGLDTHVEDVAQLIECEELRDVVLCGHSYAGMVITGVADRLRERIAHLVYLDAVVPLNGQSMLTEGPPRDAQEQASAQARILSMGDSQGLMPVFPPMGLGVLPSDTKNTAWLQRRLTPHPLKTWLDPLVLRHGGAGGLAKTYVLCTNPLLPGTSFAWHAARARDDSEWRYAEIATGHDAMVTAPDETAAVLLSALQ